MFPENTVDLLKTFAAQSVLAIQNAHLFTEIDEKSRQLEVASQHKSQFLANMSHELRTPLNAILGYTELILDNIYGETPDKMREVLDRLHANGKHLLGLINDVLDLSKIEAGQLTLDLADYSLKEVVQTVFTAVESLATGKKLALTIDVAPNLARGHGDERRLVQVLLNLVGNAIKFTDKGEVAIKATMSDGSFTVAVRDTGPGISPSDQSKIFEEFQQADNSATKRKGGTGLGLSIAKRIIAMHGGCIWVEFGSRQGFNFRVYDSGEGRTTVQQAMSKCILVVEDQEDNRQILRDLLGNAGYQLVEAANGEEALAVVATQRFDLILMDIQLPVMDGYEATRRIRLNPELKSIPIIAVTSYALVGDEAKASGGGL